MSGYLLDTNILSDLRKGSQGDARLMAWHASVPASQLHLSVITLAEIRKGIALLRKRDAAKAESLARKLPVNILTGHFARLR